MNGNLTFRELEGYPRGILEDMQIAGYDGWRVPEAVRKQVEHHWSKLDQLAFDHLDTVGRCMFITCLNGQPIGFGAFDPRRGPAIGVVGQNCILPEFRGNGYGTQQMREILRRMKDHSIQKAVVSTGEDKFFAAARSMYEACGFVETRRFTIYDGQFRCVEYQRAVT
jgi:GNAT superfamily N-acetyltransferase